MFPFLQCPIQYTMQKFFYPTEPLSIYHAVCSLLPSASFQMPYCMVHILNCSILYTMPFVLDFALAYSLKLFVHFAFHATSFCILCCKFTFLHCFTLCGILYILNVTLTYSVHCAFNFYVIHSSLIKNIPPIPTLSAPLLHWWRLYFYFYKWKVISKYRTGEWMIEAIVCLL